MADQKSCAIPIFILKIDISRNPADCELYVMQIKYLDITAFSVSFTWDIPLKEALETQFEIEINSKEESFSLSVAGRNAVTFSNLTPESDYTGTVKGGGYIWNIAFRTESAISLSPVDFGAKGDGSTDDTVSFIAAIASLPKNGYLVVPEGQYLLSPLFLKSDMTLLLQKGAELIGKTDKAAYPVLPAATEKKILGSWEGLDNPCYASLVTAINCENLKIAGEGIINGNAGKDNWWKNPKMKKPAARPRLVFLANCRNITMSGVTLKNSPSWTLHPFGSHDLVFSDLKIMNPPDSPNTDGLNPEFCHRVRIDSIHFSVGDDCIAIKAGKKELADRTGLHTEKIDIVNCLMEKGHGAVVLGSEMSGGISDVTVRDCVFLDTDRGIRLKTRRGRGGEVSGINCESIYMRNVGSAFVFNMFYFCDADGKSDAVQNKNPVPVNEGTPALSDVSIKNVTIEDLRNSLLFMYGLPERKVDRVVIESVKVSAAASAEPDYAAMMCDIEPLSRHGLFLRNVDSLKIVDMDTAEMEHDIEGVDNLDIDKALN